MINSPMHSPLVLYTNAIETAEDHCACAEASTDSRLPNDLFDAKTSRLHVNYFAVDDVAEGHCACAEANTDLGPSRISLKLSVWRSESPVSDLDLAAHIRQLLVRITRCACRGIFIA